VALAALSGLAMVVAGAPFGIGPLGWVALTPLFVAVLRARTVPRAAALALVFGGVYFGAHLRWIFLFGWMAWTALTIVLSLYVCVALALARLASGSRWFAVLASGSWAGMELVRDSWPWGGFPWGALGTTQAGVPVVRGLASAVGAYGLSFVLALAGACLAELYVRRRTDALALGAAAACLLVAVGTDAVFFRPRSAGRPVSLAVVQADVARPVVYDQDARVFASILQQTMSLEASPPDVVVWPETSIGFLEGPEVDEAVSDAARRLGRPILAGRAREAADGLRFLNNVEQVAPDGRIVATYQKRHAVPFGERVPLPFLRRFVGTLSRVPLDMAQGRRTTVFNVGGVRIATPICFESVFPRDVRDFERAGAELVVVSTNDSSFERSAASEQHLAHARMRAVENRQWVVQAALSGITAVVAPDGSVEGRTRLFRPGVLRAQVRARPAGSLYSRTGDAFAYLWSALSLAGVCWTVARGGGGVAQGGGQARAIPHHEKG
jgi:apolipoprotein N-acyltransferase